MATAASIASSRINPSRSLAALAAALALLAKPLPAYAQPRESEADLEALIPDSALDDAETWAADQPVETDGQTIVEQSLQPESPLEPLPALAVEWPDSLELPPVDALEPEAGVELAVAEDIPSAILPDAELVALGGELTLAFPGGAANFPEQAEFVARFRSLSTIRELGGDDDNIAQLAARARQDEVLLNQLLRIYGYYDAQVIRTIGGSEAGQGEAGVRFDVVPGTRYRFGVIDLGQLASAPDAVALRSAFGISSGDPLSSDAIVEQQAALDLALGESGYPFAAIGEADLLVDHERAEGDLTLPVTPGGKYVMAGVTSGQPEFLSSRHLQDIARFDPGDIYKRSVVYDLRRAVVATGLVSTVTVIPREVTPPNGEQPGEVQLDIAMTKAPLRTIAGAIGYGSEEGVRVQASWEHRNIFPPEGSLRVRGIFGTQEQLGGVTFRKNNFGGRDRILTVDTYATNVTTASVEARTVAVTGSYERTSNMLFQKPFSWGFGAEALYTDERNRVIGGIPRPRQTYLIGSVFGRATIDTSDSLLNPTKGFRVTGYIAPELSQTQGTQTIYLRNQLDASFYQRVNDNVVLAGRTRFASIQGAQTFEVAPSRRLYAGGGSSVRGYGYQAVGPRNDFGEPTGGRSLVELSAEARIDTGLFEDSLQIVPFFDMGTVSIKTVPDFRFVQYGAGIGVRYLTGFGPIRVDLGVPLNRNPMFDSRFAVYVSLGQAF
ncbi:MAG: BamA/TamA family outer membrane protein [Sphingomonadaceae bacterium]|nr:BamA/TamA family outer membrane protein [Sphingomonadaceae bacterium]